MTKQRELHEISGTLVVTATCTHANAAIFAPFIIDADKAINAWNETFSSNQITKLTEEEMKKLEKVGTHHYFEETWKITLIFERQTLYGWKR